MNAITPPLNGITATATTTTSTVALPPIEAGSTQYPMRVRIAASAPVVIRIYGDATSNSMLIGPGDATMVKTYGCTTVSMQALSGTARVNIQAIPDAFWLPGFSPYNPATQFAGGQQGAWYDPSDYGTLSQDSVGTTPVTAMAQPVGRMLDKSGRSNTMGQATAASRPVVSARVNRLVKTELLTDPAWSASGMLVTAGALDPLGTSTAFTITNGKSETQDFYQAVLAGPNLDSLWLRRRTGATPIFSYSGSAYIPLPVQPTAAWQKLDYANSSVYFLLRIASGDAIDVWQPQNETGPAATRYQRVNTAADYDTVGFPQFLTFDGIDDGLATGPVTLTADMDCFIAVRRNSAAQGMLMSSAPASGFFGCFSDGDTLAAHNNAGTPAYLVNGVAVPGGTGTTRGQLSSALPPSQWVIVETRNLALSSWTAVNLLAWYNAGFYVNGDIAGIILCPAGDATARQKNRQYLGNKVGLTLP